MQTFNGIGVSPGLVHGKAYVFEHGELKIPKYWLLDREITKELSRFDLALEASKKQIAGLRNKLSEKLSYAEGREHILILEGHLAMLSDQVFKEQAPQIIKAERINAEWAVAKIQQQIMQSFSKIDEEYFRERQNDIASVIDRVLKNLLGKSVGSELKTREPVVLIAHELSPADLAHLPRAKILGLATEAGGQTSHTGIIASAMGIPAVVGLGEIVRHIRTGDTVIVDGVHGQLTVSPTALALKEYRQKERAYQTTQKGLLAERDLPQETQDHTAITLSGNLEILDEIPLLLQQGARQIGLFRSEMLFLHSNTPPTEEDQFRTYREILETFAPHPVTMRTYDLGGDKAFGDTPLHPEANPALGLRAIRYCLKNKGLFRLQLRAMLRASPHGNLQILLPLISSVGEVRSAKKIIASLREELRKERKAVASEIKIGVMVETPAAVWISELLAKEVDFMSVGTNDLIQYTLAVDRVNEQVAYLFNALHPAVLRSLKHVCTVGAKCSIPVSLCGEMASDPLYLPVLIGLGFTDLSLNGVSIPRVKHILRSLRVEECQQITRNLLRSPNGSASLRYLKKHMAERFPEEFNT